MRAIRFFLFAVGFLAIPTGLLWAYEAPGAQTRVFEHRGMHFFKRVPYGNGQLIVVDQRNRGTLRLAGGGVLHFPATVVVGSIHEIDGVPQFRMKKPPAYQEHARASYSDRDLANLGCFSSSDIPLLQRAAQRRRLDPAQAIRSLVAPGKFKVSAVSVVSPITAEGPKRQELEHVLTQHGFDTSSVAFWE